MEEVEIKRLSKSNVLEFKGLIDLLNDVFETHPGKVAEDVFLQKLLDKPDFLALSATLDGKVIGGLTAYELPAYYGNYSEVYIYDIAVKTEHQRKGIGKLLIDSLKKYCAANNIKTMFVEAHEQDTDAVNFYHKTKARAQKVIHFEYYFNSAT